MTTESQPKMLASGRFEGVDEELLEDANAYAGTLSFSVENGHLVARNTLTGETRVVDGVSPLPTGD